MLLTARYLLGEEPLQMPPLKRYKVTYLTQTTPVVVSFDAHHYSVSTSGPIPVAHFYQLSGSASAKDKLIGRVIDPKAITEDGPSSVIDVEGRNIPDHLLDQVLDALKRDSLDDHDVIRLVVSQAP
jgi:hypothetical protein